MRNSDNSTTQQSGSYACVNVQLWPAFCQWEFGLGEGWALDPGIEIVHRCRKWGEWGGRGDAGPQTLICDLNIRSCTVALTWLNIGVGRCSDLGGRHFFKQQNCDFLEEQCLHAIPSTILQWSSLCKQWVKLGGWCPPNLKLGGVSRPPCPPLPTPMLKPESKFVAYSSFHVH